MFRNTILNASAGAGKTRSIAYRIKDLIMSGVPPEKIACISFTKSASENIMKRVLSLANKDENFESTPVQSVKFFTAHSFCYYILKKFVKEIPRGKLCETYNYNDLLLKIPVAKYNLIKYFSLEEIKNFIHQVPEEIITQCGIKGIPWYRNSLRKIFDYYLELYNNKKESGFREIVNTEETQDLEKLVHYNSEIIEIAMFLRDKRIQEKNVLLFDDLVAYAYKYLYVDENKEWIRYSLSQEIQHVFVDESQDISPLQWKVLLALIDETFHDSQRSFFIAGDNKQSIFSFQNADFEFYQKIVEALTKKSEAYKISLDKIDNNYSVRSPKIIVQLLNKMFNEHHVFSIAQQSTKKKYTGVVECVEIVANNQKDDALGLQIASMIESWIKSEKYIASKRRKIKPSDIMVLFRKRGYAMQMVHDNLLLKSIDSSGVDKISLLSSPCAIFIINLLKICIDPTNDILLIRILQNYPFFLEIDEKERVNSAWELANKLDFPLQAVINTMSLQIAHLSPHSFMYKIFFDFEAYYKLIEKKDHPIIHELLAIAAQSQYSNVWNFVEDLPRYIRQKQTHGVKLGTIHSTKGQQAPIVIVADSTDKDHVWTVDVVMERSLTEKELKVPIFNVMAPTFFNFIRSNMDKYRISEFHRELYVATTRAEDEIYFTGWRPVYKSSWYFQVKETLKKMKVPE